MSGVGSDGQLKIETTRVMQNYGQISLERDEFKRLLTEEMQKSAALSTELARVQRECDEWKAKATGTEPPAPPEVIVEGLPEGAVLTDEAIRKLSEGGSAPNGRALQPVKGGRKD